ncbi:LysR family transcriptional regulator [Maritimibacter alkaliphilus HTCC2654]|uniref:Putative LysR family transcriptional regulator n=1 Tax=Maritimibacter alkaliphilus HTCC2654 TaxID=314271 RepID=A3VLR4_9RHOB|nr:LysR family transcriptional regulator [Maritimibacter alkaliphilus]EAQ10841.1 putative LysR family transcriptional regulator [Rhodobacterales bacterium HTCC2654] [Maritimibacter alkaliphilus HTCC2654]TYP80506.1 LysR family transcriptional regulator [Maritimibacter alkaliphilus HTCC2654]
MSLNNRHLSAFVTVAQARSLGRAAEQLHITQPALSRIIRNLEETVGAQLFERHPLGMSLTPHGQALLPRAELLLADWGAALEELRSISGATTGTLRIGCVAGAVDPLIRHAMSQMLDAHPNIQLRVTDAIEDRLIDDLLAGRIDLAVAGAVSGASQFDLEQVYVTSDWWQVYVRRDHPLQDMARPALSDLARYRWVMVPEDSIAHFKLREAYHATSMTVPDIAVETRSLTVAVNALLASPLVTLMPESLLRHEVELGLISQLTIPALAWKRELYIYRRRRGSLTFATRAFLDFLRGTGIAG